MAELNQPGGGSGEEGVTSIQADANLPITGAVVLVSGTDISLSQVGQDITINSTASMGESGYSGYSGKSGYSGYSGLSGYSGYGGSGISGYSGSGVSGYSGYSGYSGGAGSAGTSGFSGFSGYSGYSGLSGYSGYSAYSGYSGSATVVAIDTRANIIASTPTSGKVDWANDLNQLYVADGSNWWVNSSYLNKDLQAPDMGYTQNNNLQGYATNYVTDKQLANVYLGGSALTNAGGVRYNPTGNAGSPAIQAYLNSAWGNFVTNLSLAEVNGVLEQTPVLYPTYRLSVFSGDSDTLGLNGLPLVQGYKVSMGCYPVQQIVDGGSF